MKDIKSALSSDVLSCYVKALDAVFFSTKKKEKRKKEETTAYIEPLHHGCVI